MLLHRAFLLDCFFWLRRVTKATKRLTIEECMTILLADSEESIEEEDCIEDESHGEEISDLEGEKLASHVGVESCLSEAAVTSSLATSSISSASLWAGSKEETDDMDVEQDWPGEDTRRMPRLPKSDLPSPFYDPVSGVHRVEVSSQNFLFPCLYEFSALLW